MRIAKKNKEKFSAREREREMKINCEIFVNKVNFFIQLIAHCFTKAQRATRIHTKKKLKQKITKWKCKDEKELLMSKNRKFAWGYFEKKSWKNVWARPNDPCRFISASTHFNFLLTIISQPFIRRHFLLSIIMFYARSLLLLLLLVTAG